MKCPGPAFAPTPLESQAAQLLAVELFRADFLARNPRGVVISELEYMGSTTSAPLRPGGLVFSDKPAVNLILDALTVDFRRWVKDRDFRKCDALGITVDGSVGELLEVTTADNVASAVAQLRSKLGILTETVNRIHSLHTLWQPTPWLYPAAQAMRPLSGGHQIRVLCFAPTHRLPAPRGVALYEIHSVQREVRPMVVPVPEPVSRTLGDLRQRLPKAERAREWAATFALSHPLLMPLLRAFAFIAGIVAAVAALIAIFDPVPGDEVAAAAAALALISIATSPTDASRS